MRDIVRLELDRPAAFDKGLAAAKAGKAQEAVDALKPLVDRLAGLPSPWVMDAMMRLGEAYLEMKDIATATAIFEKMKRLYPNSPQLAAVDVKNARVLFSLKKYDDAIKAVQGYLDPQLKKDFLPSDQETTVAEALVLLGDCLLVKEKPYEAMDCYLKVVTLYDYDDAREAEARFKTAQVLEQTGNWKRAKEEYEDLLKQSPDSAYVNSAKKRIEEINKAHKE
jgi:tetratricopeptide (TPR) repeat protein